MRFAIFDNKRVEAESGARGICPSCGEPVIAKCGKHRVPHWAHKANKVCDSWWEPETEWHREWKNKFPTDWQEVVLSDALTGEKHVADVRTSHGLVIEFQHSHISTQERISREKFYGNMLWVVDGTRLKRDYPRFGKAKNNFPALSSSKLDILPDREELKSSLQNFFSVSSPEDLFPNDWINSSVLVFFDFNFAPTMGNKNQEKNELWCLLPGRVGSHAIIFRITKDSFIAEAHIPDKQRHTVHSIEDILKRKHAAEAALYIDQTNRIN